MRTYACQGDEISKDVFPELSPRVQSKMFILKRSTKREATWLIYTLHLNKNIPWIHLRLIESSWATQLLNMKITNFFHLMSFL